MDPTRLLQRIAHGRTDPILDRLADGASLQARDAHGNTPLAWAGWARRPAWERPGARPDMQAR